MAEIVNGRLVTREYLERALEELEYRLIIRFGGMIVIATSVVATLVKIL